MSDWNSPRMRRQIRRHDRKFARKNGSVFGTPPKSGCAVVALSAVATSLALTVWSVVSAVTS